MPYTKQQFGDMIKKKYPDYEPIDSVELANKVIEKYPQYKNNVITESPLTSTVLNTVGNASDFQEQKQEKKMAAMSPDEKMGYERYESSKVGDFAIGALKGAGHTLESIGKLTGAEKVLSPVSKLGKEAGLPQLEVSTTPSGPAQKAGFTSEQVAEYVVPGMGATKALKGASLAKKVLTEALLGGGTSFVQSEGDIKTAAETAGISAALPVVGAGISKLVAPARLMKKALGLTPTQVKNLDKIAQTKIFKEPAYKDISDFALQKGLEGSRQEMVDQAVDLFSQAKSSKADILKNANAPIKNTYNELFDYLKKEYAVPGQKAVLDEINTLASKDTLTAVELDKMRYLADDALPMSAYADTSPVKTKGVQKLIDNVRSTLETIDKSGQIKKANTDIRLLYQLVGGDKSFLKQAAERSLIGQLTFKGGLTGIAAAGAGMVAPPLGALISGLGLAENVVLGIPQISSNLAQAVKNMPENEIVELFKAILSGSAKSVPSQVE